MKVLVAVLVVVGCLFTVGAAVADHHTRVLELWNCKLTEGSSMDDVQMGNAKWVKFANAQVEDGEIRSYVVTPVVGKNGVFMFADSFPSMAAWVAVKAALETEEGQAIEAELNELEDCSSNSLHTSTMTMAAE